MWRNADYSIVRRKRLLELFDKGLVIVVNTKHCPQLKQDADLKKLLKDGKLEQFNIRESKNFKRTYLRRKP
ncbi:hypothetical protein EJP02_170 [Escherichia phage EJP2]|nr:hypothetical protein EJP02_170 [Escherichia phage EJP2]